MYVLRFRDWLLCTKFKKAQFGRVYLIFLAWCVWYASRARVRSTMKGKFVSETIPVSCHVTLTVRCLSDRIATKPESLEELEYPLPD